MNAGFARSTVGAGVGFWGLSFFSAWFVALRDSDGFGESKTSGDATEEAISVRGDGIGKLLTIRDSFPRPRVTIQAIKTPEAPSTKMIARIQGNTLGRERSSV
ncbi:MAG TPA: hypothetical protein VNF70_00120 [Pyrinomonadaceae bacterium]|nr:hypothetical protein [Pyrinomonadaceae bacterium]